MEESAGAVICRCSVNEVFRKIAQYSQQISVQISVEVFKNTYFVEYCKILLIHPGLIFRRRKNLMGLYWRGAYIHEEKHFNLQYVKLFFFSSLKHIFRYFSCRVRCEVCSKLTRHQNM